MALFYDQFLRGVLFFAVGGVSSVAIVKIWENRESLLREIRARFDLYENTGSQKNTTRGLTEKVGVITTRTFSKDFIESSELEHGKCSNSKNNRVLLTEIKETNMFLRSDQLTSVALITQNNSLTLIFF